MTEEVVYERQHGKPSVPQKKTITCYDRASGSDQTVEGILSEFYESVPGHWENTLKIDGTFIAPSESVDVYTLAGVENITVPCTAQTPVWDGYETDILQSLKLDSRYFRIRSAAWNGERYLQDNEIMRNAVFLGDELVADYKAVYTADRETQGYAAKVFYRMDAENVEADEDDVTTVYHIKAVVKYLLVEES